MRNVTLSRDSLNSQEFKRPAPYDACTSVLSPPAKSDVSVSDPDYGSLSSVSRIEGFLHDLSTFFLLSILCLYCCKIQQKLLRINRAYCAPSGINASMPTGTTALVACPFYTQTSVTILSSCSSDVISPSLKCCLHVLSPSFFRPAGNAIPAQRPAQVVG